MFYPVGMGFVDRSASARRDPATQPQRHVWVKQSKEYGSLTPWPGLLIEWRRDSRGKWYALVAVVSGGVGNHLGVSWIEADLLVPAKGYERPNH
jgi:hypothetical protein